jgi:hypothetical protein
LVSKSYTGGVCAVTRFDSLLKMTIKEIIIKSSLKENVIHALKLLYILLSIYYYYYYLVAR